MICKMDHVVNFTLFSYYLITFTPFTELFILSCEFKFLSCDFLKMLEKR